jgi:hypothetical protein
MERGHIKDTDKALAALIRLDCADTHPVFLIDLVFACGLTAVEERAWCVRHRHVVRDTVLRGGFSRRV